ncbi:MAG: DUF190 domain-containing protein [Pirellulales bacterium]
MKIEGEAQLLRIFVGESDRWEGRPLYEAIVRAAREQGLAGATALRGIEGFGASSRIHTVKILRLSEDLPIVVEIVDRPERIAAFLPLIDELLSEGMVTIEPVRVFMYRHDAALPPPGEGEFRLETSEFSPPSIPQVVAGQLTDGAQQIIGTAKNTAAKSHRVFIDSVDVMLAMLRESDGLARRALAKLGVDAEFVKRSLREEVSRDETSDVYRCALEAKSLAEARWLGHDDASSEHLLLALCQIRPSAATDILMRLGAQPRDVCKEVLEIFGHGDDWQRWLADHPDM